MDDRAHRVVHEYELHVSGIVKAGVAAQPCPRQDSARLVRTLTGMPCQAEKDSPAESTSLLLCPRPAVVTVQDLSSSSFMLL